MPFLQTVKGSHLSSNYFYDLMVYNIPNLRTLSLNEEWEHLAVCLSARTEAPRHPWNGP